jgi:predicted RNA binding protein YcfA (HicA-like mRNA interferase family)
MNGLLALGFTFVSQKGSHVKICRVEEEIKRTVIIPMHEELAI